MAPATETNPRARVSRGVALGGEGRGVGGDSTNKVLQSSTDEPWHGKPSMMAVRATRGGARLCGRACARRSRRESQRRIIEGDLGGVRLAAGPLLSIHARRPAGSSEDTDAGE